MTLAFLRRTGLHLLAAAVLSVVLVTGGPTAGLRTAGAQASPTQDRAAAHGMGHRGLSAREVAFHDHMRKLWEDHITWTRLAIVTFADDSAGFPATAQRLLRNQRDIGAAIVPFFGARAGHHLRVLLRDHIMIAVAILQAAKDGDAAAFRSAKRRWYANANDIAGFLSRLNPRFWPDDAMRADMKAHLDETLTEAADELAGHYRASVRDYEAVHHHILHMADMLSTGIIDRFPGAFR
jgi:hypothetical protein